MKHCNSFLPIVPGTAKIIILGSIPGEVSLKHQQYYANPRNAFWYILASYFGVEIPPSYEARIALVRQHGIMLWDVMCRCDRQGSLDSKIDNRTIVVNEFDALFHRQPKIRVVLFNGAKAENEYKRRVLPMLSKEFQFLELIRLPSTSPAMASMKREEKYLVWRDVLSKYLC